MNSPPSDTLEALAGILVEATLPLRRAVANLPSFRALLYRLGWRVDSLPPQYQELGQRADAALVALESLRNGTLDVESVLAHAKGLHEAFKALSEAPAGVDGGAFLSELRAALFDLLVIDYLASKRPSLFQVLRILGAIEDEYHEASASRPAFLVHRLRLKELRHLLKEPGLVFERVLGWGTANFDFDLIAGYLLGLLAGLRVPVDLSSAPEALLEGFQNTAHLPAALGTRQQLTIRFLEVEVGGQRGTVGLNILELLRQESTLPGILLRPLLPAALPTEASIGERLKIRVRPGSELDSAFGIAVTPAGVSVRHPFDSERELPGDGFGASIEYRPVRELILLGRREGTRLVFGGMTTSVIVDRFSGGIDFRISISLDGSALVLPSGEGDGFFRAMLGEAGATIPIPLTIQWSSRTGLGFEGGAGFEFSYIPHLQIGSLDIRKVHCGLRTSLSADRPPDLITAVEVSLDGELGPIAFSIEDVGLSLVTVFEDGNAGPFDVAVDFKPPNGVGLSIDAAAVSGGGFLYFDAGRGQYAGAVQLNLEGGLALRALGLIATRLPDGSKGFSLLVVITAEDFKPYPLGLGFWLTRIGGLLAINRTFDEQVLRGGITNHTLDSVLFPANPTRNALQLLSALNHVFPIAPGHHLLGPMVEIQWGTPTLFTMQLAIVLEIGERLRLLVIGQIEAILPKKENDLLRIKMDAVGIIDFDQGTASLDAVLYESRLLKKFVLTGGMAMRLRWKGAPSFALAIGGLHHAFNPPANFPRLDRIAINLSAGDNPRITCEAYFAVTSNTVQFGARANLYAAAHGFSIEGDIGFDVLIQLDPFHFLAEFHASVQLKRGSSNLFKVAVEGALEGPRPLRARGKATFEVLWWDVSVSFDKTLVEGAPPPPPPAIDVLGELAAALGDRRNWQEALPVGQRRVATVRELPVPNEVRIHPLGKFGVKQTVVPLNLSRDIDKFGSSPPSGARRFSITSVTVGGVAQAPTPLTDFFAPGQFFEMTDDESITSPSFDTMDAGLMVGVDAFVFNNSERVNTVLEYKTILVDKQTPGPRPRKPGFKLNRDQLFLHARFGAAGRSAVLRTGPAKFQNRERTPEVAVSRPRYAIASTEDLSPQAAPGAEAGKPMTWINAQEALQKLKQQNPEEAAKRQVVRAYELIR
jgi:hypothetical protein